LYLFSEFNNSLNSAVVFAFTNLSLMGKNSLSLNFIGIDNFIRIFTDADIKLAIINTLIFVFFTAIIGLQILSFSIAYMMKGKSRGLRSFVGISVLAGWVTPEVVAAFNLYALFNDDGIINKTLTSLGLEQISWLFDYPMLTIILAMVWRGTAFSMMVYDAALGDIPKSVEEAAEIDGATVFDKIFKIILPMLRSTISTNVILVTLSTMGTFGLIYTLTGGGPNNATTTLPIFMYNQAFVNYQIGYGSAIALVMLTLGLLLSALYIKIIKDDIK